MDTAQWPQEILVKPLDEIVTNTCPKPSSNNNNTIERKLTRPQKEQALNCPRCNSTNTKFCYYNNYSLTQPRYFCKSCRRYWTSGGSLRNIPVGGGSRKNKRSSSSSSSLSPSPSSTTTTSSSSKIMTKLPDLVHPSSTTQTQKTMMTSQGQDLNLGFPSANNNTDYGNTNTNITASTTTTISALELLTGLTSRGFNSFMPMPVYHPNSVYGNTNTTITTSTTTTTSTASGFSLIPDQEFKPSLNFSLDGLGSGYGSLQESNSVTNGRLLFPFEDLKQVSAGSNEIEPNNKDQADSATGYWTGMLGGGSW